MTNFRDPAVIAQDTSEYAFSDLVLKLVKLVRSILLIFLTETMVKFWHTLDGLYV
jgi:hypothetical protein